MYHIELRHFPHNVCRFNLGEAQMRAIVEPWAREQWVEVGEQRWDPRQAKLTVLEGPELPLDQLALGRGWRAAQRQGEDVTQRVLAAAREAASVAAQAVNATPAGAAAQAPGGAGPLADPLALGVQIAALLGPDPMRLLDAWRATAASAPELAPSESLARAEQAVGSEDAARG